MSASSRRLLLPVLTLGLLAGCDSPVPVRTTGLTGLKLSLPQLGNSPSPSPTVEAPPTPSPSPSESPAASAAPASPSPSPSPTPSASPSPLASPLASGAFDKPLSRLGRGMNLGNALEAPKEGDWGITLTEADFRAIRQAGFNTVRVPIRWSAHTGVNYPYGIDRTFLARVDWVVAMAKANDMTVVLDMHHFDELFENPVAWTSKFVSIWKQLASHYSGEDEKLCFELLNEPHGNLSAGKWNDLVATTVTAIRAIDPTRTLVIDGPNWSSAWELSKLQLPHDDYLVGSFHLYTPMLFTHQGVAVSGPDYTTTGVRWPGPPAMPMAPAGTASLQAWVRTWFSDYSTLPDDTNPAGPAAIRRDFDQASTWAEQTGNAVWLGEFGVNSAADMDSRAAWTRFVREEAEQRGMAWAYWEFGSGFGAYDRTAGTWHAPLKDALMN